MRRMFSILTVAALMAVAVGAAATLTVEGGAIQSGEDLSLTCDEDGVAVDWGVESDEVASGQVFFVTVTGISGDCVGNELFVNVTDGSGAILTGGDEPVDITGASALVHLEIPQNVEVIEDIHVIIGGPFGTPPAP